MDLIRIFSRIYQEPPQPLKHLLILCVLTKIQHIMLSLSFNKNLIPWETSYCPIEENNGPFYL